ncbi:MAG TPA: hypothetical protein EYQ80_04845 [Candidatus Poseidoniales archaeon]|nr:hypothetical protein [Candidatus Poseidoniales archaeon]
MNLVHEAMAREEVGDEPRKRPPPKNAKMRGWTTIITWVLLNLIWMQALGAVADNEGMDHDSRLNRNFKLDVPDMAGLGRDTPVSLSCDYRQLNVTSPVVWVELSHVDPEQELTVLWEGNSTDDCPEMELTLPPGEHFFQTRVVMDDGQADLYPANNVSGDLNLGMHLWEPFAVEGYVVVNVLGLLLVVGERAIRYHLARLRAARDGNIPLHKRRQREEWDQVVQSMAGGDAVDVEDLAGLQGEEDESLDLQRQKMREQFAAQTAAADGDTDVFVDEEGLDPDAKLGEGTIEGLEGDIKRDRNIRTVGDLWRRLSRGEGERKRKR